jgi:hypothetical protein
MVENPSAEDQVFLFSYDFRGAKYSLEIPARSAAEAQFRLSQMSRAQLDGVVQFKIGSAAGPLSKMLGRLGL